MHYCMSMSVPTLNGIQKVCFKVQPEMVKQFCVSNMCQIHTQKQDTDFFHAQRTASEEGFLRSHRALNVTQGLKAEWLN